jgi:predicted dehydrogenase
MGKAVRVGVLGLRRGAALARLAQLAGMQVVAVCERDDQRRHAAKALGAAAYRDVEPFLDHAMDAVILVNDFDQHAPVAIHALDRGLSVLSETAACRTLAEGVALVEAAERSAGIYMFAENYPYMPFTREMRRRYAAGDIGEVRYAEAEYLDEPADLMAMANNRAHWRARLPATYYCTHSLAPVAAITGTRPVQVSGPHGRRPGGAGAGSPGSGMGRPAAGPPRQRSRVQVPARLPGGRPAGMGAAPRRSRADGEPAPGRHPYPAGGLGCQGRRGLAAGRGGLPALAAGVPRHRC